MFKLLAIILSPAAVLICLIAIIALLLALYLCYCFDLFRLETDDNYIEIKDNEELPEKPPTDDVHPN